MKINKWEMKASKYKTKYLTLKKQLGGFIFEDKYMTSKLDKNYLSLNLFNYWISSSHNTYLPHDQNIDKVSVCYYRLQYMVYAGGCVEIDTYGIKDGKVVISHMNNGIIYLDDVLDIIMEALIIKKKRNINSGPFIINFDNNSPNNSLKTIIEQNIFWNTINEKLFKGSKFEEYQNLLPKEIPVLEIGKDFDLSIIPIIDLSYKILFRWSLNKDCSKKYVGNDLCPLDSVTQKFSSNKNKWVHIDKAKMDFTSKYVDSTNMSESSNSSLLNNLTDTNLYSIVNSQRNLLRIFPNAFYVASGNYNNMKYFRDGFQITAINLQTIDNSRLLNDAVFISPNSKFCSPSDIQNNKCKYGLDNGLDNSLDNSLDNGLDNGLDHKYPLSYRIKPLWLIGLVPYPDLYDLEITLPDSSNYKFIYGLNNKEYYSSSNKIIIPNIDVTVPFFIVNNLEFKNGIEIVWNKSKLSDKLTFNIYKFNVQITGYINSVEYNHVNLKYNNDDCKDDKLLNYKETKTLTITYTWKESTSKKNKNHQERVKTYNDAIIKLRTELIKTTEQLLSKPIDLNEYQNMLFNEIKQKKI
jgi:hypothetical protein